MRSSVETRSKVEQWRRKLAVAGALGASTLALAGANTTKEDPVPPGIGPLQGLEHESQSPLSTYAPQEASVLERSTVDRPDEVSGPQIHPIYLVGSDGVDRQLDTNGALEEAILNSQDWMAAPGRGDGLSLRLDTYPASQDQSDLDISFFRSAKTTRELFNLHSDIVYQIRDELWQAGFSSSKDKIHLVLYDGSMTFKEGGLSCGAASWPPRIPGNIALLQVKDAACLAEEPSGPFAYSDLTFNHDSLHAMEQVPEGAPHADNTGHSTDPTDLMVGQTQETIEAAKALLLDPGGDDYKNNIVPRWFTRAHRDLELKMTGEGSVETDPDPNLYFGGDSCEDDCTMVFRMDEDVALQATPERFWRLKGQGDSRINKNSFNIDMDADKKLLVVFEPVAEVNVRVKKPGMGTVRLIGQGICRAVCEYELPAGNRTTLVAKAAYGFRFVRWVNGPAKYRYTSVFKQGAHSRTAVFVKDTN